MERAESIYYVRAWPPSSLSRWRGAGSEAAERLGAPKVPKVGAPFDRLKAQL